MSSQEEKLPATGDVLDPTPPKFVEGMSEDIAAAKGNHGALTELVIRLLQDSGWAGVEQTACSVTEHSGLGGFKVYKVAAPAAKPPAVALRVTEVTENGWFRRSEAAYQELAQRRLVPARLAHGSNWFIEEWVGVHLGETSLDEGSTTEIQELAELMARIHKVPTAWFDSFHAEMCTGRPVLQEAAKGSCMWWPACRAALFFEKDSDRVLRRVLREERKPSTPAGSRLVTVHGDFHAKNIIRTECGELKAIDLEYAHANHAIEDIAYTLQQLCVDACMRRDFVRAYLEAMGDPSDAESVDALVLESVWYIELNTYTLPGQVWVAARAAEGETLDSGFAVYRELEDIIDRALEDPSLQEEIIENGLEVGDEDKAADCNQS